MTDDVLDFMAIDVVATDSDDEVTTMACLLTGPIPAHQIQHYMHSPYKNSAHQFIPFFPPIYQNKNSITKIIALHESRFHSV
jgi:hypothetical protein